MNRFPHPTGSRRIAIVILFFLITAGIAGCTPVSRTNLTVYAFPAGAADAFLITTEHSAVLIDCASKGDGKLITDYMEKQGIDRLDYLIISHFDKDHIGGAKKVIRSVPADHVLQPVCVKGSETFDHYMAALSDAGIEAETVTEDLYFELDGVEYWINPPAGGYQSNESNNASLIVSIANGKDKLLFTGDAENERITEFLNLNPGPYDVMKVPHHGKSARTGIRT
ncbi:MAG: ComEC/Rec2 family competence protein, partial [Clostridia bacterium]